MAIVVGVVMWSWSGGYHSRSQPWWERTRSSFLRKTERVHQIVSNWRHPPVDNDTDHASHSHWGRVTHICVSKLPILGSDNGLSPVRHQSIIWTKDGILLVGPLGINFKEISIEILAFPFKKMRLKVTSAKWRPYCLGFNVLKDGFLLHTSLSNGGKFYATMLYPC